VHKWEIKEISAVGGREADDPGKLLKVYKKEISTVGILRGDSVLSARGLLWLEDRSNRHGREKDRIMNHRMIRRRDLRRGTGRLAGWALLRCIKRRFRR
jgi:hypothetical protein